MKYFYVIVTVFLWNTLSAQQVCDCEKEFLFVKSFIETNYPGFKDKVTPENKNTYNTFTNELSVKAKSVNSSDYCYYTIQKWLSYFKDGHIQMIFNLGKNKKDSSEYISLSTATIDELKKNSINEVEGLYHTSSKQYQIALVKNSNSIRDYAGVILTSSVKTWKPGQIKVELKHIEGDKYEGIYYYKDRHPEFKNYTIKNGKFDPNDFIKDGIPDAPLINNAEPFPKLENSNTVIFFKKIDDSTNYIRIKSFDDRFAKKIKSVIESNKNELKSKPYLILDLRYNGGGSDFTYNVLLPFIYTNPIKTIGVDILSTPDNIKTWQKVLDENPHLPAETKKQLTDIIEQMKANPFKLINVAKDETDSLKTFYSYPKKVAVLIDENCASTTEQFLLAAKQSKKVILMGHHTAGVLDYSNMRMVNLDCLPYVLGYSTSRSRRIPVSAIDNKGITPDITLDFSKAWLVDVLKSFK